MKVLTGVVCTVIGMALAMTCAFCGFIAGISIASQDDEASVT